MMESQEYRSLIFHIASISPEAELKLDRPALLERSWDAIISENNADYAVLNYYVRKRPSEVGVIMNVAQRSIDPGGNTPVQVLNNIREDSEGQVWGKLEYLGPGSSIKDRIAKYMVEKAEEVQNYAPVTL